MAYPIPAQITCPACGATERVTLVDSSVGPAQLRGAPRGPRNLALARSELFRKTYREPDTWLSCTSCGAEDFGTVSGLVPAPRAEAEE